MKKPAFLLFTMLLTFNVMGQTINISDELTLIQVTGKVFIHTCNSNNGIVYINGNDALIVSTPDTDQETQHLINWVTHDKKATIVGYVIDRWPTENSYPRPNSK